MKKCLFFDTLTGGQSVERMLQRWKGPIGVKFWEKWMNLYQGVRAFVRYKPDRTIVIGDLTQESSLEYKWVNQRGEGVGCWVFSNWLICFFFLRRIKVDGNKELNLVEFFRQRKNIELKYPEWPALIPKGPNEIGVFPLEQICIMANQRVPQCKFNSFMSSQLITVS